MLRAALKETLKKECLPRADASYVCRRLLLPMDLANINKSRADAFTASVAASLKILPVSHMPSQEDAIGRQPLAPIKHG